MSPIDIIFYTGSLTLITIFLVINVGLKNSAGIKYSVLFLLVLLLLWAAEGWIYPLLSTHIDFDDLRPVYLIGFATTLYGFWMVPGVYEGDQSDWIKHTALGGMAASALLTLSLFVFPTSTLGILFYTLLIIMFLLHALAAKSWRTYTGRFNWLAFITPILAVLGTVALFYGQISEDFAPQLIAYSFRVLFTAICILVLSTLFLTYLDLQQAHERAVIEALEASEQEAERARQLLEMEHEYRHAREVADQHAKQLSSASHDIRQPIASIRAELDAMRSEIPETKRERFEHIFAHVDALMSSFQVSSSETHNGEIHSTNAQHNDEQQQEEIPVSLIFSTLDRLFQEEAKKKGIELRFVPSTLVVTASAIALLRVASNLLSNAISHAGAGRILVGARRSRHRVRLCIFDNGKGISDADLEAIFQRGVKGDESEGSGLGLAIVKEISDAEQFQLQVKSALTLGTVWEFSVERSD